MSRAYREVRVPLSFFGVLWRILFWGWQILMVVSFLSYTLDVAPLMKSAQSDAAKAGAGIGIALSWGLILFSWVGGSVILGLFVLLTQRARVLVPVENGNRRDL